MSFYRNHPKRGVFFHSTFGWTFALKKGMFNLNENNRFVMSRNPMDLRKGVDSLCGTVRSCAPDPLNGDVYVSSNRGRTALKLLHWERGGYTLYYRRLSVGRFHQGIFLRESVGFRSMRRDELVLLMEGISLGVARRKRYLRAPSRAEEGERGEKIFCYRRSHWSAKGARDVAG